MNQPLYNYRAKIVRVVDGDTVDVLVDLGFHVSLEMKLRLNGINAPELNTEAGRKVRDMLKAMIEGKDAMISTFRDKQEKYGRFLAVVTVDSLNVNDWLLKNGHAVVYNGVNA